MKTTLTGAEFKAFYADNSVWDIDGKPAWYIEELEIKVDGATYGGDAYDAYGDDLSKLPDEAKVTITGGWLGWQGQGNPSGGLEQDLGKVAVKWKAERETVFITATFEVSKQDVEKQAMIQDALLAQGGKVKRSDGQAVEATAPRSIKPR